MVAVDGEAAGPGASGKVYAKDETSKCEGVAA
jgi:hypothetical protein